MDIISLMDERNVIFDSSIKSKKELFEALSNTLKKNGYINSEHRFIKDIIKREKESSTGIEKGFGIPHAKSKSVIEPTIAFAHTAELSDYIALDDSKVECVFMIAVPEHQNNQHLDILSFLARKLMNDDIKERLMLAKKSEEIISILKEIGG